MKNNKEKKSNLTHLVYENRFNENYIHGKLGEYIVMHQLMSYRGWHVEHADYYGADLIAIDIKTSPSKKYAIQVKLRFFYSDAETNSAFDFNAEQKLREFCKNFSTEDDPFIPLVAYVNINRDQSINTVIINVNDLADIRYEIKQNYGGHSKFGIGTSNKNNIDIGYICNTNTGLQALMSDPRVTYYRLANFDINNSPLDNTGSETDLSYLEKIVTKENKNENALNYKGNQIGDFGEWFFMMKAVASGVHPLLVKSVGTDIILFDTEETDNGQAVSVKTFSKKENDHYEFEYSNVDKLDTFSKKWRFNKEPLVALQMMIFRDKDGKKEYYKMYNFTMTLSYMVNAQKEYLYESGNGYTINWSEEKLSKIQHDDNIEFDMVVFDEPYIYEQNEHPCRQKSSAIEVENKILHICKEKKLSTDELSVKTEISKEIINKIINNEYTPSLKLALRISEALEVSVNELFSV